MYDDLKWSPAEKKIARSAFDSAYRREMDDVKNIIYEKVIKIKANEDVWALEKFLSDCRKNMLKKYDYRYSQLIPVFYRLYKDGYLYPEDLEGLNNDKIKKIFG